MKTPKTSRKKDAARRLDMEREILAIKKPRGYTFDDALRIVVPRDANGDHCLHCHRIFHKAWDSLIRQGLIEEMA